MFWQWIKNFMIALTLLPATILGQITDTMQDTGAYNGAADGAASTGWWWFWVVMLLLIVGIAIWWAARTGAQGGAARPRGGAAPRA
ncbi:MAG: hypothetical protein GX267_16155 [Fibrobacter sp.]|jgi:lipoprotein signal peptidase|nr:hypothetical protein [Fibrobacter sp.]